MTQHGKCSRCGVTLLPGNRTWQCLSCLLQLALGLAPREPAAPGEVEKPGDFVGPYLLVDILGEGGHGTVYLAEQEQPVRRTVALKLIKPGMDSAQVIARFEAERQALAMMDHPNIARVLDAGTTPAGRPFFVMELVEGERITGYCNRRQFTIQQRIELFATVCDAVQHAHQKGIVHRDLKPGNILVFDQAGVPVPKVIDFGIAKAMGGERLTDKTLFTGLGQFIGTPAYMSPEQAELGGIDVDTRSDIYSLGILLYELLTGTMPFDPKRLLEAGLDEVRRIIREEEPPRPSTRLSTLTQAEQTTIACQQRTEPWRHIQQVRGDLDCVVMKALEKDRERRYQTVSALALDARRFLQNEAIEARPPSNAYRLRKTIQRNKLLFGATAIVFASLITSLVISTWRFRKEKEARQRAAIAEQEQARLRQIAELRAYSSDMSLAAQTAQRGGSLNGLANLLDTWQNHTPDLRGWEWYYLNGFLHHDEVTVVPDGKSLRAFSWSPDGQRFAVGGNSGTITIWNAQGRKESMFDAGATIVCLAWHPVKDQLIASTSQGQLTIWDTSSGAILRSWQAHRGDVRTVAWSADGRRLASGGYNDKTVVIWDGETGAEVLRMQSTGFVHTVAWIRDGSKLANSGGNQTEIWDTSTGKLHRAITPGGFAALDWSPDGRFLALGGFDSQIRIWEPSTGKLLSEYFGHGGSIAGLKWSPDGQQIISTGREDGAVNIWEPLTGKMLRHFRGHLQGVHALAWSRDGTKIGSASLDGTAKIWDTKSSDPSKINLGTTKSVASVAWSADGQHLLAGGGGYIQVWNAGNNALEKSLPRSGVAAVAWHPGSERIASGAVDGNLEVWDLAAGTNLTTVRAFEAGFRFLRWNRQGTMLAAAGSGFLKIWDATAQNLLASVDVHYSPCYALDWSPDGKGIVGAAGFALRIVDVAEGRLIQSGLGHRDTIRCVAWSPDGKRLASGGEDTVGLIWDSKTGAVIRKLPGHSGSIYGIAWSPDGERIATGSWDCSLKIWNPNTGQELCSISTYPMPILTIAWHSDGRRIVVGFINNGMAIFDSSPGLPDGKTSRRMFPPPEPSVSEGHLPPAVPEYPVVPPAERDSLAQALAQVESLRKANAKTRQFADALDALCLASFELRRFVQTEAAARELLPLRREQDGATSASYMHAVHWLGLSLLGQKQWPDAEPFFQECLSIARLIPNDPMIAAGFDLVMQRDYCEVLLPQEKYAEVEPLLLATFEKWQNRPEQNSLQEQKLLAQHLIRLYEATGREKDLLAWRQNLSAIEAQGQGK
jgi:WD40 repeat protein/serine/threonine protein kinase